MQVENNTDRFLKENLKEDLYDFPLIDSKIEFYILRNFHQKNQNIQRKIIWFKYLQYASVIIVVFFVGIIVGNKINHIHSDKFVSQKNRPTIKTVKTMKKILKGPIITPTFENDPKVVVFQKLKKHDLLKLKFPIDENNKNGNDPNELPSIYDIMKLKRIANRQINPNILEQENEFNKTNEITQKFKFVSL